MKTWLHFPLKFFVLIIFIFFMGSLIRKFGASIEIVQGESMSPNLPPGTVSLTIRDSLLKLTEIQIKRGDIVIFKINQNETPLIKRVMGLPGEKVWLRDGTFFVNGKALNNDWAPPTRSEDRIDCRYSEIYSLNDSQYFLLGDNRCRSFDSRYFGAISREQINAKILNVLF